MKKALILFVAGMLVYSASAVMITKDSDFGTSIMIEDFNGTVDPSFGNHALTFVSIGEGMGRYGYAAGGSVTEAYASFNSATTFDPALYSSIRLRMNSNRSTGEDGDVDLYAFPIQGDGKVRFNNYPNGTTFREASWDLGSASPSTPFNGTGLRIDPFNYANFIGTDYWNVDYIMADMGQSRGAEFDSNGDLSRYFLRDIINISLDGSVYSGTSTSTDPQIHLHTGLAINADTYKYIEFRVKADTGSEIKWFWKTALTDYMGVVLEPGPSNDGAWHTYLLDMTDEPEWTGSLTYNRFDPTNVDGASFEVDYVRFRSEIPPEPVLGYEKWAGDWGVDIGSETNDYDLDGISNLYEFGLDGDPTNAFDQGTFPVYSIEGDGGSNVVRCISPQRSDPDSRLSYSLSLSTNLVAGNWTTNTGYVVEGTRVTGGALDFVTNTTNATEPQKYIRLVIDNRSFTLWQLAPRGSGQMMSYVLQSSGGKLIVIDGGREGDGTYLKNFLSDRGGHIDGWFITHPHEDHIDALTWILANQGTLQIDHIYISSPAMAWMQAHAAGAAASLDAFYDALDSAGRNYTDADPGDVFDVDEIHIEILATENTEITVNAANNSSMVLRVSDPMKSVLFLGDAGLEAGDKLLANVDHRKLKVDYVQMAHHGQGAVSEAFYQVVQPQCGLWPTPVWLWNNDNGGGYDSGPWTTLETRQWMDDLKVKTNYVSGLSGLIKIK